LKDEFFYDLNRGVESLASRSHNKFENEGDKFNGLTLLIK